MSLVRSVCGAVSVLSGQRKSVVPLGVSVSVCLCVEGFIDGASESLKCSFVQFESLLIAHI